MGSDARVGLAGATGALGREILRLLDKSPWRPDVVVPLASERTSVSHVDYGDEHLAVDILSEQAFEDLDVVILAVPPDVARQAGARALGDGVAVVDCSGAMLEDPEVPMVVPWINPEVLSEAARGVLALPRPEAILLASVLGPLHRSGLSGPTTATVLVPASLQGRAGIDELSRQVVAMFNQGTPPRKVFPYGLAFDLLPRVGEPDPSSEGGAGWTMREREVAEQTARLVGLEQEVTATLVGVPVFSGISAELQIRTARRAPVELVAQILTDGGVKLPTDAGARVLPRPRRVEGQPFAHAGRLRVDDAGALHVWASMDNLATAAAAAVSAAGVLVRRPGV